jgi:hypothetical protein
MPPPPASIAAVTTTAILSALAPARIAAAGLSEADMVDRLSQLLSDAGVAHERERKFAPCCRADLWIPLPPYAGLPDTTGADPPPLFARPTDQSTSSFPGRASGRGPKARSPHPTPALSAPPCAIIIEAKCRRPPTADVLAQVTRYADTGIPAAIIVVLEVIAHPG